MNFNFVISSLTFLQYYLPLISEANRRGIQCNYWVRPNRKDYTTPVAIPMKALARTVNTTSAPAPHSIL